MTKKAERLTLRLTEELKEQLDESRRRMGISFNALVVRILWDWAERQNKVNVIRHFDEEQERVGIYQHKG